MAIFRTLAAHLAFLLFVVAGSAAQAQLADPWKDWLSADSAHFRVHYRSEHRAQAQRAIRAAENAYPRITTLLQWEPRGRTEIVLFNEFDLANGYATPLPYNTIGVFLALDDEGQLLDNSAWLDLLLTHEFTHIVHLDKVRGAPKVLQAIFGRVPWFFPNLFQPMWAIEGLAVYTESTPAGGRGRLRSPLFEAQLRAQATSGFLSLSELNADGRALPLTKSYLYGAYFYDFLARRYGEDAIPKYVERYSGNVVPRLHSGPYEVTGKMMDVLWDEFLVDLASQVDQRASAVRRQPQAAGQALIGPLFDITAVAALPSGAALAVLDDGLRAPHLVRVTSDGTQQELRRVNRGARLDAAPDGRVLVVQPDLCEGYYLAYDVYRLETDQSLRQLTHCARLRRAVQAGETIVAIQNDAGSTRLLQLDAEGRETRVLVEAAADTDLIDLAASPDGQRVQFVAKREDDWQVLELSLAAPGSAPRLLARHNAPVHGLRHTAAGLEFIAAYDGVYNVWRLAPGSLQRLTHSHTSILAHSGTLPDGASWLVAVANNGVELRHMTQASVQQRIAAVDTAVQAEPAAPGRAAGPPMTSATASGAGPGADSAALGDARPYAAWRSIYPRSWFPAITADRGLSAYGASTFGGDALGWHRYAGIFQWETSQGEAIGGLEYLFLGRHHLALSRSLESRAWTGASGKEDVKIYDRATQVQWLSTLPFHRLERRLTLGVGAALDINERIDLVGATTTRPRDERLAALLIEFDTSGANWWSEGENRGQRSTLLYETYKPFARSGGSGGNTAPNYDGEVLRLDLRGYLGMWSSVLAVRHTEARARGFTELFQLGGALDPQLQLGTVLNSRRIALRGYDADEPSLVGTDARVTSIEWRAPLADVDRHGMVPPFGLNRLSATLFFDIGGAWTLGERPAHYKRGAGVELIGEVKLLYSIGLQLRGGIAKGLDAPREVLAYLSLGRAF
ncbi:MAG: hypothetical protein WA210_18055 [Burkholderiaceae bacterium]